MKIPQYRYTIQQAWPHIGDTSSEGSRVHRGRALQKSTNYDWFRSTAIVPATFTQRLNSALQLRFSTFSCCKDDDSMLLSLAVKNPGPRLRDALKIPVTQHPGAQCMIQLLLLPELTNKPRSGSDEFQMSPCAHTRGGTGFPCREGPIKDYKILQTHTNRATPLPWTQHQDWETTRATNKVSSRLSVHFSNTGLEWVYLTTRLQFLQGIETRT